MCSQQNQRSKIQALTHQFHSQKTTDVVLGGKHWTTYAVKPTFHKCPDCISLQLRDSNKITTKSLTKTHVASCHTLCTACVFILPTSPFQNRLTCSQITLPFLIMHSHWLSSSMHVYTHIQTHAHTQKLYSGHFSCKWQAGIWSMIPPYFVAGCTEQHRDQASHKDVSQTLRLLIRSSVEACKSWWLETHTAVFITILPVAALTLVF